MFYKMSETGSVHKSKKEKNQDSVTSIKRDRFAVASLADGVTTCKNSKRGAEITSNAVSNLLIKNPAFFFGADQKRISKAVISYILDKIKQETNCRDNDIVTYSSTISSVLYDKKLQRLLYFNLGDSLILGVRNGKCMVISKPFDSSISGCCVTTTWNADRYVSFDVLRDSQLESIIILSDGAWENILDGSFVKDKAVEIIESKDYEKLSEYLLSCKAEDDCSFIAMDLNKFRGGVAA